MNKVLQDSANSLIVFFTLTVVTVFTAEASTPIFDHYDLAGPWVVAVDEETYASGQTGVVYRPVSTNGSDVFPVVVWGNGSGGTPEGNYPEFLRKIASWGYVITATNHEEVGTGAPLLESLDHLRLLESDAGYILHGQIDFSAVAAVGHSQGAGGSTKLAIDTGDVHTLVPLALPAPQFVFEPEKAFDTADVDVPMFIVGAVGDFISDTPTVQAYFNAHPDSAAMAMVANSPAIIPHLEWAENGGGVSRAYIIAWLEYILRSDSFASGAFTGENPEIADHLALTAYDNKCLPGGELPRLTPQNSLVWEGSSGQATVDVRVTLAHACNRTVSIDWATVNTLVQPEAGVDFQPDSGNLVLPPGQASATVPFTVYSDAVVEVGGEQGLIEFFNPSNAHLGNDPADDVSTIFIYDGETPPGC
ncbi:MAG: hypothetical protein Hals2KO_39500 [Halioglobus sp.]